MDIVESFPKVAGNKRYLLVGTDYFTKWVEAESLANIRDGDAKKFVWKNIVTRFGIPYTVISNNELQFDGKAFRRYCCNLGITNIYSTPPYPQGNRQAEAVNKVIVSGLKKRLDDANGKILSLGLEFLIPLSRIMDFSLTIKPLGGTVAIWE